jgi:hypothetical protein
MPKMFINVFEVSLDQTTEEGKTVASISHRTMYRMQDMKFNEFSSML